MPAARKTKILRKNQKDATIERVLTKPALRRLCRRGGVKRISSDIYATARQTSKFLLGVIMDNCLVYTEHAKRSTINFTDVRYAALKATGMNLYGEKDAFEKPKKTKVAKKATTTQA